MTEGIRRDKWGWRVHAKVGSGPDAIQQERHFQRGTSQEYLKRVRDELRSQLRKRRPKRSRGTLSHDVDHYVSLIQHLVSWRERRAELESWRVLYGDEPRHRLTSEHVRRAMVLWRERGKAPKTVNHRVQTLQHLYRTLDGRDASTPCDDIPLLPVPRTPPVVVEAAMVNRVVRQLEARERTGYLRDAATRARFMVLASTGRRASEIMRTQPADVDLTRRVWYVRDGKGGQTPGLYLNDDMLAAWQLFIRADAWGPFETSAFARTIRAAGWPEGVRPYNLRHSTWIAASERGIDLADIQAGAGHKSIATTRRHYVPVLASRMQRLSESLEGRFGWMPRLEAAQKSKKTAS